MKHNVSAAESSPGVPCLSGHNWIIENVKSNGCWSKLLLKIKNIKNNWCHWILRFEFTSWYFSRNFLRCFSDWMALKTKTSYLNNIFIFLEHFVWPLVEFLKKWFSGLNHFCAQINKDHLRKAGDLVWFGLVVWVLWHINLCRLFNAKCIFIQIVSSISNNSV